MAVSSHTYGTHVRGTEPTCTVHVQVWWSSGVGGGYKAFSDALRGASRSAWSLRSSVGRVRRNRRRPAPDAAFPDPPGDLSTRVPWVCSFNLAVFSSSPSCIVSLLRAVRPFPFRWLISAVGPPFWSLSLCVWLRPARSFVIPSRSLF